MHFKEIIATIKTRRKSLQVTQEEVSELSGVSLRTLKQFESSKGNLTMANLQKLCDTLGLEIKLTVKEIHR
ncbi:helix-turn-helix domain-containing protein [Mucilaginibacter flavus]|uniref:helix-turn-helix domain-containing protein n=1 Tax=Mucilaginibacter flavus TaxID=931504 RepID=UPI0025B4FDD2|nr:helix-turn-helix domain-containing protein [Mucilaginibacter flavus]MDN3583471.1 helix-turn-helix domain-containing protein [Mucilaginibacter flavus]